MLYSRCPALHVCRHYIIGDCTFGPQHCDCSHSLHDAQPLFILKRFGMDQLSAEDVNSMLRPKVIEHGTINEPREDGNDYNNSNYY